MIAHNLPRHAHAFVGRKVECAEIIQRLVDPNCRLLTIVGPGGIGKTRLAAQISAEVIGPKTPQRSLFQDGVYFVSLQALISSDFNLSTIADSLNLQFAPDSDPEEQLLRYLRPKSLLLVLDNFEHLLDGVSLISRLLAATPRLKILATSREALNVQEEWLYVLSGMEYPQPANQDLSHEFEAMGFFAAHAKRVQPAFSLNRDHAAVKRICQLVEGMPLALELAASWMHVLSASEVVTELEQGLDILETRATNVPQRHRNMRVALDASWNRMTNVEQTIFKQLSVFRGGFTREAAQAVGDASRHTLAALIDKSWLRPHSEGRYDIQELLRQYGSERLLENSVEAEETFARHSAYYANYLAVRRDDLNGEKSGLARTDIETELENIRLYWDWTVKHKHISNLALGMDSLWTFYDMGNRFQEGERAFAKATKALEFLSDDPKKTMVFGKVMMYQAFLCQSLEQDAQAKPLLIHSLAILEQSGDLEVQYMCLAQLAMFNLHVEHDLTETQIRLEAQMRLAEKIGTSKFISDTLASLGCLQEMEGKIVEAHQLYLQSEALMEDDANLGDRAALNNVLSRSYFNIGEYAKAFDYASRCHAYYRESGILWGTAFGLKYMSNAAWGLGRYDDMRTYIIEALKIDLSNNLIGLAYFSLTTIARLRWAQGDIEGAVELLSIPADSALDFNPLDKKNLLVQLGSLLSPEAFAAAVKRGQSLELEAALHDILAKLNAQVQPATSSTNHLTKRQTEILLLIAQGFSNQAIADQLVLTLGSVKWYVKEIFTKLEVRSRTQAIAKARELNIITN